MAIETEQKDIDYKPLYEVVQAEIQRLGDQLDRIMEKKRQKKKRKKQRQAKKKQEREDESMTFSSPSFEVGNRVVVKTRHSPRYKTEGIIQGRRGKSQVWISADNGDCFYTNITSIKIVV
jgi:hypothetical protein